MMPSAAKGWRSLRRRFGLGWVPLAVLTLVSCGDGGESPQLVVAGPEQVRQGEVVEYRLNLQSVFGELEPGGAISWSVEPTGAGLVTPEGRFVGYLPGAATIVAMNEEGLAELPVTIEARSGPKGTFRVLRAGQESEHFTSDLWLREDVGLTGTWLGGEPGVLGRAPGDRAFVWDLAFSPDLSRTAALAVDARTVNDVKIAADRPLAVLTHEGSAQGLNGLTLLDLTDPLIPSVITRFTEELEPGVHNVWIEGDFLYAAVDGVGNGLRIIDITDPARPTIVARFAAETSFLHDVMVRNGLAFLCHWDAGLIILDVGHGIAGGSPQLPVEVSRLVTRGGQTHNAWYWPESGYVFVGEEDFETPGRVHVVDVSDLTRPREVASFAVAGETPHNFWLDEERGVLYAAWYTEGVRAIDVSGELLGELEKQGREIAANSYGSDLGCRSLTGTCSWAPQLHEGLLYVSDLNSGLWVLEPEF